MKTYEELKKLKTFEERFKYLKLSSKVGFETFGYDRWLNQKFYKSKEWRRIRDFVIVRDGGCDLGIEGFYIYGKVLIHHMNPISKELLLSHSEDVLDPNYLITVSLDTHNALHYGNEEYLNVKTYQERRPNDTKLW